VSVNHARVPIPGVAALISAAFALMLGTALARGRKA